MNKLLGGAIGVGMALSACASDTDPTEAFQTDRSAEIERLSGELDAATEMLTKRQQGYESQLGSLPTDCLVAVEGFLPSSDGAGPAVSSEKAMEMTREWCGPDNLLAVPELRTQWGQMTGEQDRVDKLTNDLAANVAAEFYDEAAILSIEEFGYEDPQLRTVITNLAELTFTECDVDLDLLSVTLQDGDANGRSVVVCFPLDGEPYGAESDG